MDVAVVQLCDQFPQCQIFIFGPQGERFWAKEAVVASELRWLETAVACIEQQEVTHSRPFVVAPPGQPFTAMALDAEGSLSAVVLIQPREAPAEVRAGARPRDRTLNPPAWLKVRR